MPAFWSPWQDLQCQDPPEQPENFRKKSEKKKNISSLSNIHTQKKRLENNTHSHCSS